MPEVLGHPSGVAMKPGRPVTTRRGRAAGAKEARAWLSAEEFAHVEALAAARGLTVPALVRAVLLWTVA